MTVWSGDFAFAWSVPSDQNISGIKLFFHYLITPADRDLSSHRQTDRHTPDKEGGWDGDEFRIDKINEK